MSFALPVENSYKFRADLLGGQYFSDTVMVNSGGANSVDLNTGGGVLTLTLQKAVDAPMDGIRVFLFNDSGAYLGLSAVTDTSGQAIFDVPSGAYTVRADYLDYQYWSDTVQVASDAQTVLTISHQDVVIGVIGQDAEDVVPRMDLPLYLFTEAGTYQNITKQTDAAGQAVFSLPPGEFKFRANYLNSQYWSEVVNQTGTTIVIPEGRAEVSVTLLGAPLESIPVYVYDQAGAYLGLDAVTDINGIAAFRLPQGEYNFRADFMGSQYFSGNITLIPDKNNPIPVDTGGANFTLTVEQNPGSPLSGVICYLFTFDDDYLGHQTATSGQGEAVFELPDGNYKIRIDYLGYHYWTPAFSIPTDLTMTHLIDHQDIFINVQTDNGGNTAALSAVETFLFTATDAYQGISEATDADGKALYSLPPGDYKVRIDYLNRQYWTADFNQANQTVTIQEGTARVQVLLGTSPVEGSTVFVYDNSGVYLGLNGVSDGSGFVDFQLPEGTYKFRADFQSSQYWITELVTAHHVTEIELNTGGGAFELTIQKEPATPLENIPVYVFSGSGSYLGITASTDSQGKVSFDLSEGAYKFRVDYMGYNFWTDVKSVPLILSDVLTIAHSNVTISVDVVYNATREAIAGVKVYLFTGAGAYQGINATTDAAGQVVFNLPDQAYKVRVDFLGRQFWSAPFTSTDPEVDIAHGYARIQVTDNASVVEGANVYLFKDTGAYLGRYKVTDTVGEVSFFVPEGAYKFRVDYNGTQYWSDVINLLPHEETIVPMQLDLLAMQLTNDPAPDRFDGKPPEPEPVLLASLFDIQGLLSHAIVGNTGTGSSIFYYINDHLGTPQKVVDESGTVVWEASYQPFGEAAVNPISNVVHNFRFAGQYYDQETGLHYNYHRYYDPMKGRYLMPDPVGLEGGINLYVYAYSNPINLTDPYGLEPPKFPYQSFPGMKPTTTNPFYSMAQNNVNYAHSVYSPWSFREKVKNKGEWDYKQYFPNWQDFGNYNYGVTGAATGLFTLETLLREAGRAQCEAGTSEPKYGNPKSGPPYGDDPDDQYWIIEGWKDYMSGMYGEPRSPSALWGVPIRFWGGIYSKYRE